MARKKKSRDSSEFTDDEDHDAFQSTNGTRHKLNVQKIKRLKHNHPDSKNVSLSHEAFSHKAWEKLGLYIATNDHVECMSVRQCNLNDDNMSVFFKVGAGAKNTTKVLTLYNNSFGSSGMRSMVPFLQNSNLTSLNVSMNNIETEGFWWLMNGLNGGCIEKLNLRFCGLTNISILERCSLGNLQVLYLSDNGNIGANGCKSISKLLQRDGSNVKKLYVNRCNIGDEGAELIADALASNTVLTHLELETNNIYHRGHLALLRAINNVSEVERTYHSNHVLRVMSLTGNATTLFNQYITEAININRYHCGNGVSAGREKVVRYHLNSSTGKILAGLQGVGDYFMRPYIQMESAILPHALALVGQESVLSDMYRLLRNVNSDLGFSVYGTENKALQDKVVQLNDIIAEQNRQIAALTARNLDLRTKLASINHFAKRIETNIEESDGSGI